LVVVYVAVQPPEGGGVVVVGVGVGVDVGVTVGVGVGVCVGVTVGVGVGVGVDVSVVERSAVKNCQISPGTCDCCLPRSTAAHWWSLSLAIQTTGNPSRHW